MNEKINLTKILKDCPKGTKLYSSTLGDVTLKKVDITGGVSYPIIVSCYNSINESFTADGKMIKDKGECTLFPAKDQRNWSEFKAPWYKKERFDPKTLNPFDKILVQRYDDVWMANFLSNFYTVINPDNPDIRYLEFITITNGEYRHCIPYNDDTKNLLGTNNEAPEYYRYWED